MDNNKRFENERKKYTDISELSAIISSVGQKILDLIQQNNTSIEWYRERMTKENGTTIWQEEIEKLEKENELILIAETLFWKHAMTMLCPDELPF